ncbi:aminotransferase [Novosphingobium sp.]|uniref:aminotransferase n=1 Tax=Novosphingobium sp. TaxID=1874826 RepID=UPI002B46A883|nr:aminotransferase [Novosphingobium sp.]HKR91348.1 aminotransferase [Novosphingobium sp.]
MKTKGRIHPVYAEMERTVFDRMSALAREHGAINLGQGFPDAPGPTPVLEAAVRALREKSSQYPPGAGLPELREALCGYYARRQELRLEPDHVIVTSGATEALACAVLALVQPGDEVVLFQPAYDAYAPMVRRAGGVPVSVMLQPPRFAYDAEALERAISPRTRLLMLNDPLNPAGTVASEVELATIACACVKHDLIAICDEVWEEVRFDTAVHRSLISFDGMAERTVKIGSAGKIFGITGWKIGWMIAQGELAMAVSRAHQFLTYASAPPLQWAVAEGLAMPSAMLEEQRSGWARSRARLKEALQAEDFAVLPNTATWFLCVDLSASGITLTDRQFATRAVAEAGVATIPVSALYEGEGRPEHIIRLCFTKPENVLDDAARRLARWRRQLR